MVERLSINALSEETGIERRELKKALMREGVPFKKDGKAYLFDAAKARTVAKAILDKREAKRLTWADVDVELLSPVQRKDLAAAKKLERENRLAEKVEAEEWMAVSTHHEILRAIMDALERLPGKLRSELGLSETQANTIRARIDECREDAAKKVEAGK